MNGQTSHMKNQLIRRALLLSGALLIPATSIFAQQAAETKVPEFDGTIYTNPMFIALVVSALLLMILIMVLGDIIKSSLHHQREIAKKKSGSGAGKTMMMIALMLTLPALSFAQDAAAVVAEGAERAEIPQFTNDWYGLDGFTFWTLVVFNLFEIVIVIFFLGQIRTLLGKPEKQQQWRLVLRYRSSKN